MCNKCKEPMQKATIYACDICQKTFTNKRSLNIHNERKSHLLRSKDPEYVATSLDASYHDCECGGRYQGRSYKSHIESTKHKQGMELAEFRKMKESSIDLLSAGVQVM